MLGTIKLILLLYKEGKTLLNRGLLIEDLIDPEIILSILRINQTIQNSEFDKIEKIKNTLIQNLRSLTL